MEIRMEIDLGFSPSWFLTGVIDSAGLAAFHRYAANVPARSARSWRWLAFRDFVEEHTPLDEEQCRSLFALGESEPDANLGTAMMCSVLHQSACPADVRAAAAAGNRYAVRRAAR
jgi:hypothetical protein